MKVVCENCRSAYRVPDEKLTKTVNKATCRQCGHKMLIPRARLDGDPDERTLVTRVPLTPGGAPIRSMEGERITANIEDEPEETLSGKADDVDLAPPVSTPEPPPRVEVVPSLTVRPAAPPPVTTDAVTVPRAPTPPPAARVELPVGYDPSTDLAWAKLGVVASMFGALLLTLLSVFNSPMVMWAALTFSFGGGALAMGILITGERGRRPAAPMGSLVAGGLFGVVAAAVLVGSQVVAVRVIEANDIDFANLDLGRVVVAEGPPSAVAPPKPEAVEPEGPEAVEANAASAVETAPVAVASVAEVAALPPPAPVVAPPAASPPPPAAAPPRRPTPAPTASTGRTTPPPAPTPPPTRPTPPPSTPVAAPPPAPAPAPPASPPLMESVPVEVIHVMLSNNVGVKKCFVPLLKAGTLPSRVDVRFALTNGGKASGLTVSQPELKGTDLERCLGGAVAGIPFPATSGSGQNIVYPFVLK